MAPKGKQQAAPKAEAKAKPQAAPKSDQPAPKAKAEPKAKAAAQPKAAVEPPAAPPAATPKASAKAAAEPPAKASGKAKAKADPAPAAGKASQPKPKQPAAAVPDAASAGAPKSKAKAQAAPQDSGAASKAKSKAQAAPQDSGAAPKAKSKAQAAPQDSGAAPKAKSKGKAKSEPKAPPPPPEPEPVVEEEKADVKKKKTNHRGGRNKNKEEIDNPQDTVGQPVHNKPNIATLQVQANNRAASAAEKDPEIRALRDRLSSVKVTSSTSMDNLRAAKTDLEALAKDIDKTMADKKGPRMKTAPACSTLLESSLKELEQCDENGMMEAVKKELSEARAAELWNALKSRLSELKANCEEKMKSVTKEMTVVNVSKGTVNASRATESSADAQVIREQAMMRRLRDLHGIKEEGKKGEKPVQKSVELDPEITKYLFSPPHRFSSRFEQQYKVRIEAPRGAGKGQSKGTPSKDFAVIGLHAQEVNDCVETLKALDFSGTKTMQLDGGLVVTRRFTEELEQEFKVIIFKLDTKLEVFGKKAAVESVLKKVETDSGFSLTTTVPAELVKVIYNQKLLEAWRGGTSADIKINQPPKDDSRGSQPAKITITGKSKAEAETAMAKVEDFRKNTITETMEADGAAIGKLFERTNDNWLARAFRDIRSASSTVILKAEGKDGFTLVGNKKDVATVKAELNDLLKKATYEPVKVSVEPDHVRIFSKDKLDELRKSSGLMDIYKDKDGGADKLVLLGDAAAIAKAKAGVQEVLNTEGTIDNLAISESAFKDLTSKNNTKVKAWQGEFSTHIVYDREKFELKIIGSTDNVEATKKAISSYAEKVALQVTQTKELKVEDVGRVIGSKGSTLTRLRQQSGAQVYCHNEADPPYVQIEGQQENVDKALVLIEEVLGEREPPEPKAKAKAEPVAKAEAPKPAAKSKAPAPAARTKSFKGDLTQDFPSLGGSGSAAPAPKSRAWGKSAKDDEKAPQQSPAQAYPSLPGGAAAPKATPAPAPAKVEAVVEEEEEAEDCDMDPLAMLGGMGEEEVYQVTLMEEKTEEAKPEAEAGGAEEEEEAGDDEMDPLAMLSGMGEEEVYKVTLMDEAAKEEAEAGGAEEEEEAGDDMDPLAMLSGMGEEEVYKVTLVDEAPAEDKKPETSKVAPATDSSRPPVQEVVAAFNSSAEDFPALGAAPSKRR